MGEQPFLTSKEILFLLEEARGAQTVTFNNVQTSNHVPAATLSKTSNAKPAKFPMSAFIAKLRETEVD